MKMKRIAQLQAGEELYGFCLLKREAVAATAATLYTFRHSQTGAELLFSQRDCENKSFGICFETLPENHTGVFHILEHSVLCGSDKYPVKEPFVVLLQSSLQTFLNAMTFSDKTVYPVSSRNTQDFYNLMRIYLDAVFCPAIYRKPEIFQQEGWHYETQSADDVPTYNGVVFSEMKGAYSDVDEIMEGELAGLLFPDTCYRFSSGGDPKYIPDLTYEEFIRTHQRFYHPSNAKIFLDGAMEAEPILRILDGEYLSGYTYRERDFGFTEQTPVVASRQVTYQISDSEESYAHLVLGKILCRFDDYEKIYAAKVLCSYLTGSNEAPLQRAILEAGLGQEAVAQCNDGIFQPYVTLKVRNTKPELFASICDTLQQTVARLRKEGLDQKALTASLERLAFQCREVEEPYGLVLGLKALDSWLYGGDPTAHWNTERIFAALREKLGSGYFAELLQELFGTPDAMCRLEVLPASHKVEQEAAQEAKRLEERFASWDAAQKQAVLQTYENLLRWQQTPDAPEAMAMLPKLALGDIPEKPVELKIRESECCGCRQVEVSVDTHGIAHLQLWFSLADLTAEELRTVKVMTMVLGELSTARYPAVSLHSEVKTWFGSLEAKVEVIAREGETDAAIPYLTVAAAMLEENGENAAALLLEILRGTLYTETDRIGETLAQNVYALQQSMIGNGHSYAITRALAPFTAEGTVQEALSGESFVRWLEQRTEQFRQNPERLAGELAALQERIFCRSRLTVGVAGALSHAVLRSLTEGLAEGERVIPLARSASGASVSGLEIPSSVNYCAMGQNLYAMGRDYRGPAVVLGNLLSFGYLWNAVRVQGGAYGTGMLVRGNGDVFCYSYRDPNPQGTLAVFREAADFLEEFCTSGAPLDDLIIGTVGQTEPLLGPGQACRLALIRYLRGTTYASLWDVRKQILRTTAKDLEQLIPVLRAFSQTGAVCVVGGKEAIRFLQAE